MRINPYFELLLHHVTDLLNDPVTTAAELERRWLARGMPRGRRATRADLALVQEFVADWAAVVDAASERERVARLNRLLGRHATPPSITDHDGSGWHLHYRDPAAGFGPTLAGATSAAAAQFLTERGMSRLGRCRRPGCGRAFVDLTRPGTQRYCGHRCANRDAVRRHRARAAAGSRSA